MRDDRTHWEERYQSPAPNLAGAEPSAFLAQQAAAIGGRVLDLACGTGRNSLFLARRGNRVDAIDIALGGLKQLQAIAAAEGLRINCVQADLRSFELPENCYDAVINIRYLERLLFPSMARALKPGGLLIFETFLIDQQQFGHPRNPDFLLKHGELREAFQSLDALHYDEGLVTAEKDASYMARLVARRPALRND